MISRYTRQYVARYSLRAKSMGCKEYRKLKLQLHPDGADSQMSKNAVQCGKTMGITEGETCRTTGLVLLVHVPLRPTALMLLSF